MTMNPNSPTPTPAAAVPAPPPAPVAAPGTTDAYEILERLVAEGKGDYQKAIGGNKAAGTRVRKSMQDIKAQAQAIRVRVLESRSTTP
jgi:hypothetical protein